MDAQAPAVVAVVVTTDPGPWLDETLASLAAQDYAELSVLILSAGDEVEGVAERVGRVLPDAFVRHLPGHPGYPAATNEALGMVEGAAFFLLLHDDCALDPDAVGLMAEEAFRSNAGLVSPKFVNWDDPNILLHVGMSCDKTGAVVERILDGEVDHGQHDAVRDVFVAPGGCMLIRADLWRELGGFDAGIVAMGEDLDLSWRCQVAGSRVVVAPQARVRHREVVASGLEPLAVVIGPDEDPHKHPITMQALQRRHELRTVLKCYSRFHLLRVLPQVALLAFGETLVALLARDRDRARAVVGAWRWNLHHRADLRARRKELRTHRLFPDAEIRRLQLRGSARLSQYFSRLSHQGLEAANAVRGPRPGHSPRSDEDSEVAVLTGSVGLAFSEDSDFDDLDDLGHRSGRDRFGRKVRSAPLSSGRQRVIAVVVAALVVLLGTRELLVGSLPSIGQLAPLPGWSTTWLHFFSGWQSVGLGSTAPATPAFGLAGLVGTVLVGAMGLTEHVLLLGAIPLGAVGLWRFLRPIVSPRASVVGAIAYLALPLPYAALGAGRFDGLVAYAAFPFVALQLARLAGIAPFDADPAEGTAWRHRRSGRLVLLGATVAIATSFAPAVVPMVLATALCWEIGATLVSANEHPGRVVRVALEGIVIALVLDGPWVVGSLLSGRHVLDIFGLPVTAASSPSWGEVVRFAVGPAARSPLAWLLLGAAVLPLLLGTSVRLAWAARLWVMACGAWVLALAATHGWMGSFTPSETVVLAPAGVAIAAAIGLGISAFEHDLSGQTFGWRQVASGVAIVATVLGAVPVVLAAGGGRWDMPNAGVEQTLSFLGRPSVTGSSVTRVLWLGDPRSLPIGGWSIEPGLAYALTGTSLPTAAEVWTPAGPGPASLVAHAVTLAMEGETVHLGQLLAGAGVRYIVVLGGLSPSSSGLPVSVSPSTPTGLTHALLEQNDLQVVPGEFGLSVFANNDVIPVTAERPTALAAASLSSTYPAPADLTGWSPLLGSLVHGPAHGSLHQPADVLAQYAPAGQVTLTVDGHSVARRSAFGWAAQFPGTPAGHVTLAMDLMPYVPIAVLLEVVAWAALLLGLAGWRRWPRLRRRRRIPGHAPGVNGEVSLSVLDLAEDDA